MWCCSRFLNLVLLWILKSGVLSDLDSDISDVDVLDVDFLKSVVDVWLFL